MNDFIPGAADRKRLLNRFEEVDVTQKEAKKLLPANFANEKLVKREVLGRLAEDICVRLNVVGCDDNTVFITELEADVRLGDETWENFKYLVVECHGHVKKFESNTNDNCFVQLLEWLNEAA